MKAHSFSVTQDHVVNFAVALFFLVTASFLFIRFIPFFFTPKIILTAPLAQNSVLHSDSLKIQGRAVFISLLTLNGEKLYIAKTGAFEKEVKLAEGMNLLMLQAKNRFGRKAEVVRRAVYIKN